MTDINLVALQQQQHKARQTFAEANFAYVHALQALLYRLGGMKVSSGKILLCGVTDATSNQLLYDAFPAAEITCIQYSQQITSLPLAEYDIVLVNVVFSLDDVESVFAALSKTLAIDGVLLFSMFGTMTLSELKQAFGHNHSRHVSSFYDMHDMGDSLLRVGLSAPVMENLPLTVRYRELSKLFRDLRLTGCTNVQMSRPTGLGSKAVWANMLTRYQRHRDGLYHVTLDFIYGHAWKSSKTQPKAGRSSEVHVPLSQLKRGVDNGQDQ
jgi:hypothetical protein